MSAAPAGAGETRTPLDRIRTVLVRTSHPGNIGAAARAAWTMGIDALVLVAPRQLPRPARRRRARPAPRACSTQARVVATLDDALADCAWTVGLSARPREFAGRVVPMRAAAQEAIERTPRRRRSRWCSAARCRDCRTTSSRAAGASRRSPRIPRTRRSTSRRPCRSRPTSCGSPPTAGTVWQAPRFEPATHAEIEGLHAHAERTLAAMRFLDPAMPRRLMPRLRRLFARAGLEHEEVNILRGILARVDALLDARATTGSGERDRAGAGGSCRRRDASRSQRSTRGSSSACGAARGRCPCARQRAPTAARRSTARSARAAGRRPPSSCPRRASSCATRPGRYVALDGRLWRTLAHCSARSRGR